MPPKIIKVIKQVRCGKNTKMFCLETGESVIVPAGTIVDRFTPDEKRIWFAHRVGEHNFELELGIKYIWDNGKFVRCKSLFQRRN